MAIDSTGNIGCYMCLFMQTQFQLGSYIYAYTIEHTFSSKYARFSPYSGRHNYMQLK